MRFIVNKQGTKVWHEIPGDTLVDWTKEDSKERAKMAHEWVNKARHGEIYVYGTNHIVAVDVPE